MLNLIRVRQQSTAGPTHHFEMDLPPHNHLISSGTKKRELILPGNEAFYNLHEAQQVLYQEYSDLLNSQDAMDFDDILILAYRIFIERPKVAELYSRLYKYVCIDEAQDLNYAQYEIIKTMCLGRHNNIYEEPRDVLRAIPGIEFIEMERNRESSLCCGGGGGGLWNEVPADERFSVLRVEEAAETGAEIIAAACPYCISMFEDALKTVGKEEEMKVMDISEIVLQSLES